MMWLGTAGLLFYAYMKRDRELADLVRLARGTSLARLRERVVRGGRKGRSAKRKLKKLNAFQRWMERNSERLRKGGVRKDDSVARFGLNTYPLFVEILRKSPWTGVVFGFGGRGREDGDREYVLAISGEPLETMTHRLMALYGRFFVILALSATDVGRGS